MEQRGLGVMMGLIGIRIVVESQRASLLPLRDVCSSAFDEQNGI